MAPHFLPRAWSGEVGLLVGTMAQTKAGPEIKEANTDRLAPIAYGPDGWGRAPKDPEAPRDL